MKDGYPTKREIRCIRTWDAIKDPYSLIEYICNRWRYSDYFSWNPTARALELHTAGWSGNEELIGALMKNLMFWALYWQKSERGGHYYFTVKRG